MRALQFTLDVPAAWTLVSASTGPASDAAVKSVVMNPANGIVLVFGFNQTIISTGIVANIQVAIAGGPRREAIRR